MAHLFELGCRIAEERHEGQEHFFGDESYYKMHLLPVAGIVRRLGYGEYEQTTAILHDIMEDTDTTRQDLRKLGIPQAIVLAVGRLTKKEGMQHDDYIEHISKNPLSTVAKYADSLFNLSWTAINSPTISDKNFGDWVMEYQQNLTVLRAKLPSPQNR